MKFPSESLYKETLSKNVQVPVRKTAGLKGPFGAATPDVWALPLNPSAKVVLMGMAMYGKGEAVVGFSHGFLAGVCVLRRSTVAEALDDLESAGLIRKAGAPAKQVQPYEILHPALVTALRVSVETVKIKTWRESPSLVKCARCPKKCRPHKTGWCMKCRKEIEQDAKIRRIAQTVMAQAVAERLAG